MLKKIISFGLATIFTVAMGTTQAASVELTADQMDNISAGWYWNYLSSTAMADATAAAFGDCAYTSTVTSTLAAPGVSASGSSSVAVASSYYY